MFKNIGSKLKTLAKILAIIEIICFSFIALLLFSITLISGYAPAVFAGLLISTLIVGLGFFIAWLTNCQLYAFGELVDANSKLLEQSKYQASLLERIATNSGAPSPRNNSAPAPTPQPAYYTTPAQNSTSAVTNAQNTSPTVTNGDTFTATTTQPEPTQVNDQNI